MTDAASSQPQPPRAIRGQDATVPAEQVIRRVLLRRGFSVDWATALLVAEALQALYQARPAEVLQVLFHASPPALPRPRPRQRMSDPGAGCEPMF